MDVPDFTIGPELKTVAMPHDTNPGGDIFGGWILSQMDLAGGMIASRLAKGHVMTVAVESTRFYQPIHVGDEVSCYTQVKRIGRTSVAIDIVVWVQRMYTNEKIRTTEGVFVYVAVDDIGRPRPISPP